MTNTWLKFKAYVRLGAIVLVLAYVFAFVLLNRTAVIDTHLHFVFKSYERPNALLVLLLTAVFSIFGWWLFKTVFRTIRQMREVNRRAHLERIEKEHAEMVAKAAKLQTRPDAGGKPGA